MQILSFWLKMGYKKYLTLTHLQGMFFLLKRMILSYGEPMEMSGALDFLKIKNSSLSILSLAK